MPCLVAEIFGSEGAYLWLQISNADLRLHISDSDLRLQIPAHGRDVLLLIFQDSLHLRRLFSLTSPKKLTNTKKFKWYSSDPNYKCRLCLHI